jgi:trk system potassium uptake protein
MRLTDILDFLSGLFSHRRTNVGRKTLPIRGQEFAVIGLGRFGSSLAQTLVARGHTVLAIDRDPTLVQQWADDITQTVSLDTTDEDALRDVDITSYETVVVAIGTNFEANLLTVAALKSVGVRNVISKAATHRQRDILLRVGADRVVLPEHEGGARMAQELSTPGILDQIRLNDKIRVSELRAPRAMAGKTVAQLELEKKHQLFLTAIASGEALHICPAGDYVIQPDDLLVVVGDETEIARLLLE